MRQGFLKYYIHSLTDSVYGEYIEYPKHKNCEKEKSPFEIVKNILAKEKSQTLSSLLLETELKPEQIESSIEKLKKQNFITVINGSSDEAIFRVI